MQNAQRLAFDNFSLKIQKNDLFVLQVPSAKSQKGEIALFRIDIKIVGETNRCSKQVRYLEGKHGFAGDKTLIKSEKLNDDQRIYNTRLNPAMSERMLRGKAREEWFLQQRSKTMAQTTSSNIDKIDQEMKMLRQSLKKNRDVIGTRCDIRRTETGKSENSQSLSVYCIQRSNSVAVVDAEAVFRNKCPTFSMQFMKPSNWTQFSTGESVDDKSSGSTSISQTPKSRKLSLPSRWLQNPSENSGPNFNTGDCAKMAKEKSPNPDGSTQRKPRRKRKISLEYVPSQNSKVSPQASKDTKSIFDNSNAPPTRPRRHSLQHVANAWQNQSASVSTGRSSVEHGRPRNLTT